MLTRLIAGCLILCAILSGCTPMGEGVLRRNGNEPAKGSSVAGESAVRPMFDVPDAVVDPETKQIVSLYGPTIKHYADRYGLDWRLILATIKQESQFRPEAESHRGASGLMQIMPTTGAEVAKHLDVDDLSSPENNIHAGVFYLRKLYDLFEGASEGDRVKLTLAAYNAGIGRLYDAQDVAAYLHEDPLTWNAIRDVLPLLNKRHQSLHRAVWQARRPKAGYFVSPRQTLEYVDRVLGHYDEYRLVLN